MAAGVPAGRATPFRIGSVTKTFVAATVLRLAEAGDLELDAPVGAYLPGTAFGGVGVRALLAHTGGVPREVPVDMWESMRGPDRDGLLAAFGRAGPVGPPGRRWHYSNLGYAALGQVVEELTGKTCADAIDAELIGPLGLRSTTWTRPPGAAVGYRVDPYADLVHPEPDMDQAAAGVAGQLWSTADDLLSWGHALTGGAPDVVPGAVVDAMHTVQVMVDPDGWTSAWGLGLVLDRRDGRVASGHTGAMPGFLAALSLDRRSRAVGVALANTSRRIGVGEVAAGLVDDVLAAAPPADARPWTPGPPVPAELAGVLGRWWSEADETVFSWRGGRLHAELASAPGTSATSFARTGPDTYRAVSGRWTGELLRIRRGADGTVTVLDWATYPFTREPR